MHNLVEEDESSESKYVGSTDPLVGAHQDVYLCKLPLRNKDITRKNHRGIIGNIW